MQQAEEASKFTERVGGTVERAQCLVSLAWVLHDDGQLDAAEETVSRAIILLSKQDGQFWVCDCHRVLGKI